MRKAAVVVDEFPRKAKLKANSNIQIELQKPVIRSIDQNSLLSYPCGIYFFY
jgi:hypothetical protein